MTVPRELALLEVGGEIRLTAEPLAELKFTHDDTFTITASDSALITIGQAPHRVEIRYDAATHKISIDRSRAWFEGIEDGPQFSPPIELQEFTIRTIVDHGSLELFIPEAGLSMTSLHSLPATGAFLQNPAN